MLAIKKQLAIRKAIMDACNTCVGHGCRDCAFQVEIVNKLANAEIPAAYWDYTLDSFKGNTGFKDKIIELTNIIENLYTDGKSFSFTGKYGVGKTFGACMLLRAALLKGYTAKYTTMNEIIDMVLAKEDRFEFKQALLLADFVVIDELDSRYIPTTDRGKEMFGTNLEYIIRSRLQNKLPIIFCTNNSRISEVFDGAFEQTFSSLFSKSNITEISVGGVDLRK